MATSMKETANILNGLVQTCLDGEEGFRTAAEGCKDGQLRMLFRDLSAQRAQFATELESEVVRLGEVPTTEGSLMGSLHRGWINLKSAITGSSDAAIVSECERGEDSALEAYSSTLEKELPATTQALVARQYAFVRASHDHIRNLELAQEHAHS